MSTVEYKCPECGHRLFAEPNTPFKYHCPNEGVEYAEGGVHPEALVVQVEQFLGPNFLYRDVGEDDKSKTGIITPGTGVDDVGKRTIVPVIIPSKPKEMTEEEELEELRAFWFRLTGSKADGRLKNATLRRDIEELERKSTPEPEPTANDIDMAQLREEVKAEIMADLKASILAELKGTTVDAVQEEQVEEQEQGDSDADSE